MIKGMKTTPALPEPFRGLVHLYEEARRAVAEREDLTEADFDEAGGMMVLAPDRWRADSSGLDYGAWCRVQVARVCFLVGEVFGEYRVMVARRTELPGDEAGVILDSGCRKVVDVVPARLVYPTRALAEARVAELTEERRRAAGV